MSQPKGRRVTRFCREWTTLELATVRRLAGKVNAEAIGKAVNRTPDAVRKFARCNGISLIRRGEHHPNHKHTDALVRAVRDLHRRRVARSVIASGTGMSKWTVAAITNGRHRKTA